MKLISDEELPVRKRRVVTFLLEDDTDVVEMAFGFTRCFRSAAFSVTSKHGEHVLPRSVCADLELLRKALGDMDVTRIEVGEGAGLSDLSFTFSPKTNELFCYGNSDRNIYEDIKKAGQTLEFGAIY